MPSLPHGLGPQRGRRAKGGSGNSNGPAVKVKEDRLRAANLLPLDRVKAALAPVLSLP